MRAVTVCLCVLLTACGAKTGRIPVRIAATGPVVEMHFLPVTLAATLGYYQEEGLDVTLENMPSSVKTLEALMGSSADAASVGYLQAIQMAASGQRIRCFFVGNQRVNFALVTSPRAKKKIERVEDLAGALIGVTSPGSPSHQWVNYTLAKHGVNPADVRSVGIGGGATAMAALDSGRIDAAGFAGGNHIRYVGQHPEARVLVDGSSPEAMRETFGGDLFASGTLAAKQEWLDRNPDTARHLCRALQKALRWIAGHTPEEIRERLPEASRSQDVALDLAIIRWGKSGHTPDGRMPPGAPEAVKRFLDFTSDQIRDAKIDLAATWTNEFLEGSK